MLGALLNKDLCDPAIPSYEVQVSYLQMSPCSLQGCPSLEFEQCEVRHEADGVRVAGAHADCELTPNYKNRGWDQSVEFKKHHVRASGSRVFIHSKLLHKDVESEACRQVRDAEAACAWQGRGPTDMSQGVHFFSQCDRSCLVRVM